VSASNQTSRPQSTSAGQLGRQAGHFVKHVVPAAVKPVHSLWHEVLGFFFLAFAGLGVFKLWRNIETLGPIRMTILGLFIVIMAGYGVASFLKARKISRS
jgi:hypothetical protein